jgi:hypothetical protein
MGGEEIARFPPILQLAGVGLLALYVAVSLLGRVSSRFRWFWADADEARTKRHWMEYTIFPALLLAGALWAVIANWNPAVPLTGGWTIQELALGPGLALLGVLLVAAASVAQRARETAVKPAPAWIPPVMMLIGLAALIVGVLTLGRTVKASRSARASVEGWNRGCGDGPATAGGGSGISCDPIISS